VEDKPKRIVIKKVKKHGEGHHGGSWKVAYADFVTAMMAFFLMLWLLSMVSTEKRAVLAAYFKDFSLFEKGGKSFMMDGGIKPTIQHQTGSDVVDITNESGTAMNEEIAAKILASLESRGDYPKNQVLVEMSPDGIRIQIVDSKENPIFPPGSAQLTDAGKKIIESVSTILRNFRNEIAVEGHTDGSPTRNDQISNWELSTARASAARRQLENDGIDPGRIARVVGFADKAPFVKDQPDDPRNRRISLLFVRGKKAKPVGKYDWLWKEPSLRQ
jgi:chemotaxis protein MotB